MVVALVALFVACGGTAVAAGVLITSSSQLRNGVVTGAKIANRTITGKNVARGSLGGDLLSNGQIGTNKLTKDAVAALQSSGSTAYEYFRKTGPEHQPANGSMRVVTAFNVPSGVYAIFGKVVVTDLAPPSNLLIPGSPAAGRCQLSAGGDIDDGSTLISSSYGSGPGDVYTQITHTFAGAGDITMDCTAGAPWRASDATIIAVRLGNATRNQVSG
jgi:hypothetical protein